MGALARAASRLGLGRVIAFSLVIALGALRVIDPPPIEELRLRTFDFFRQAAPREVSAHPAVFVDIDEESLKANPDAKSGSMVASATKGVLCYVGGQISHSSGVTITTPSAVLGIRGGIATLMLSLSEKIAQLDPNLAGHRGNGSSTTISARSRSRTTSARSH